MKICQESYEKPPVTQKFKILLFQRRLNGHAHTRNPRRGESKGRVSELSNAKTIAYTSGQRMKDCTHDCQRCIPDSVLSCKRKCYDRHIVHYIIKSPAATFTLKSKCNERQCKLYVAVNQFSKRKLNRHDKAKTNLPFICKRRIFGLFLLVRHIARCSDQIQTVTRRSKSVKDKNINAR